MADNIQHPEPVLEARNLEELQLIAMRNAMDAVFDAMFRSIAQDEGMSQ
jgi:hypothetical protein